MLSEETAMISSGRTSQLTFHSSRRITIIIYQSLWGVFVVFVDSSHRLL